MLVIQASYFDWVVPCTTFPYLDSSYPTRSPRYPHGYFQYIPIYIYIFRVFPHINHLWTSFSQHFTMTFPSVSPKQRDAGSTRFHHCEHLPPPPRAKGDHHAHTERLTRDVISWAKLWQDLKKPMLFRHPSAGLERWRIAKYGSYTYIIIYNHIYIYICMYIYIYVCICTSISISMSISMSMSISISMSIHGAEETKGKNPWHIVVLGCLG